MNNKIYTISLIAILMMFGLNRGIFAEDLTKEQIDAIVAKTMKSNVRDQFARQLAILQHYLYWYERGSMQEPFSVPGTQDIPSTREGIEQQKKLLKQIALGIDPSFADYLERVKINEPSAYRPLNDLWKTLQAKIRDPQGDAKRSSRR